jgi:signal transduction histidine kinase
LIPLVVLLCLAALFVGCEVIERTFFPTMSIGWKHALLTIRATVVTVLGCAAVYLIMRRQQWQLASTAGQLSGLLESYATGKAGTVRFENPFLVHCREVLACGRADCPMHDASDERCWQVMALSSTSTNGSEPAKTLEECHKCPVYLACCPNQLTALGESFNNLMFLLEEEAATVDRMRAQLVERQKMVAIGQIGAGVAHEVRNPLSSISSVVQMLKRRGATGDVASELDVIESHIERIASTVRQLIGMARPTVEGWERVDLGDTLTEAVRLVRFDPRASNVSIQYSPPRKLPSTYALPGQVQQLFINLLLNAFDAMPDGGTLGIRAQRRVRKIVVSIEDTGGGIAPEVGRRVFEPFFTTKEPGQGAGLGLAVCYNVVEKHGGRIEFDSRPGGGTIFTVEFPILAEAPAAPDTQGTSRTAGRHPG